MKKATTAVKVEEAKPKRMKKEHKFFLYAEGKGFIRLNEKDPIGMPNFKDGEIIHFATRSKAMFARDFFISVKLAESIDIFAKIA